MIFLPLILNDSEINYTESFNRIEMSITVSQPAYIIVSQSFNSYWTLTGSNSSTFIDFLNVSAVQVNTGMYKIDATFSASDQTYYLYAAFFSALALTSILIYSYSKHKKTLLNISKTALIVFWFFTYTFRVYSK